MDNLRSHILTGLADTDNARFVRGAGMEGRNDGAPKFNPPPKEDVDPETGLPYPPTTPTDNPALDGELDEQPSVRSDSYDVNKAVAWMQTAAAVQKATGVGPKGINWSGLAAAVSAGAAAGAVISGPGAIVGAIIGAFVWVVNASAEAEAAQPWNAYSEQFDWMRSNLPPQADTAIFGFAPDVVASGVPAIVRWIAAKMLMPATDDEIRSATDARFYMDEHIRGAGLAGQAIVDNDTFLWRTADGTAISMQRLFDAFGGYESAKEFYIPTGVDYPLTRLMNNPAGSTSADPDVEGIVSDGSGGVYMLKGARFVYEGAIENIDGADDSGASGGSSKAALGLLLLLGFAATKKST